MVILLFVVVPIVGTSARMSMGRSFKLGAIRLTERFVKSDPLTARDERKLLKHLHSELNDYLDDIAWWYMSDEEITLGPEVATQVMIEMSDPRGKHWARMRHENLPPEHLFGRRLEMLTLAVLGQLRATTNWYRIAREWIYDDEPVTELGKLEAEFYASPRS